jgi:hypothetical protein|tara:strand:- start:576 stop:962 length:387 start_codon:yes stop_codon:yes gene_type:complete
MANLQRLTERVKKMEEWIKENDMTGGPQGVLETFVLMVNETRASTNLRVQAQQTMQNLRALAFEFIGQHELTEEWNEFLADKEKEAVQEQSPEEVPSLTEAEDGEEVGEEDTKGKKPSKEEKSKETKK